MKKTFNILFALLLLLTGCHSAPAAEQPAAAPQPTVSVTVMEVQAYTAAPTDLPLPDLTPAPVPEEDDGAAEERIVGHCISILDALPYRADLTGDGQTETVDLVALPGETDGQPRWTVSVQKGQETKLFQTDVPEDMPCDLFAGDLDENGTISLTLEGRPGYQTISYRVEDQAGNVADSQTRGDTVRCQVYAAPKVVKGSASFQKKMYMATGRTSGIVAALCSLVLLIAAAVKSRF